MLLHFEEGARLHLLEMICWLVCDSPQEISLCLAGLSYCYYYFTTTIY